MAEVCVLLDNFKRNRDIIIIQHPSKFHQIGQELFKIIWEQTHRQTPTHTQTHIHKHADENNTCPKTKFLGQVKKYQDDVDSPNVVKLGFKF